VRSKSGQRGRLGMQTTGAEAAGDPPAADPAAAGQAAAVVDVAAAVTGVPCYAAAARAAADAVAKATANKPADLTQAVRDAMRLPACPGAI